MNWYNLDPHIFLVVADNWKNQKHKPLKTIKHIDICKKQKAVQYKNINSNLQGTELNILGSPISSENVTIVPVGPMTHLTVFDASVKALAALSCIKLYKLTQIKREKNTRYR